MDEFSAKLDRLVEAAKANGRADARNVVELAVRSLTAAVALKDWEPVETLTGLLGQWLDATVVPSAT